MYEKKAQTLRIPSTDTDVCSLRQLSIYRPTPGWCHSVTISTTLTFQWWFFFWLLTIWLSPDCLVISPTVCLSHTCLTVTGLSGCYLSTWLSLTVQLPPPLTVWHSVTVTQLSTICHTTVTRPDCHPTIWLSPDCLTVTQLSCCHWLCGWLAATVSPDCLTHTWLSGCHLSACHLILWLSPDSIVVMQLSFTWDSGCHLTVWLSPHCPSGTEMCGCHWLSGCHLIVLQD